MNKKNIELQRAAAQGAQTQETYSGFEESVLSAARTQAQTMIDEAHRQGEELFAAMTATQRTDPLEVYRAQEENTLRRRAAAAKQDNRRKLLVYRKQLTEALFAEVEESLQQFVDSPAYAPWVAARLALCADVCAEGCTVYVRVQDTDRLAAAVRQALPGASIAADRTIRLGGVKVAAGHLLFDETLDSAAAAERTAFLSRCGLCVE